MVQKDILDRRCSYERLFGQPCNHTNTVLVITGIGLEGIGQRYEKHKPRDSGPKNPREKNHYLETK